MLNGGILKKEIAGDIDALENTQGIKVVVKNAIIRALRLGESAGVYSKQNRMLLIVILALQILSLGDEGLELVKVVLGLLK